MFTHSWNIVVNAVTEPRLRWSTDVDQKLHVVTVRFKCAFRLLMYVQLERWIFNCCFLPQSPWAFLQAFKKVPSVRSRVGVRERRSVRVCAPGRRKDGTDKAAFRRVHQLGIHRGMSQFSRKQSESHDSEAVCVEVRADCLSRLKVWDHQTRARPVD